MFQKLRVHLKGHDGPVDIQTTARDWAAVPIVEELRFDILFQVAYNALTRSGVEVADDYGQFLDDMTALPESLTVPDTLDPTPPEVSGTSP
jgi:hypothetical protein